MRVHIERLWESFMIPTGTTSLFSFTTALKRLDVSGKFLFGNRQIQKKKTNRNESKAPEIQLARKIRKGI